MNSMPAILTIRPRGPLKNKKENRYNKEEEHLLTNRDSNIKLPSLSPNSSVKTLHKPYPITKVSLVPISEKNKLFITSKSNTKLRPNKISSKLKNYKMSRIRLATHNLPRLTPSPGLSKYSSNSITEISGMQIKIHARGLLNDSIYKINELKNTSFS